jgi:hypothetical protein
MTKRKKRPSLLDRDATGGGHAQAGFLFQDNFVLANVPRWLSDDGFAQLTQEAMGDVEVQFFEPGISHSMEYFQVKNHDVSPTEFRAIVDTFVELLYAGNYRHFSIACGGISDRLKPFVNALRRIQTLGAPYNQTEIGEQSLSDLVALGTESGLDREEIDFVLRYVSIVDDLTPTQEHGDALFRNALVHHFQEFNALPGSLVTDSLSRLRHLIHTHKDAPIHRQELETALFGPTENSNPPRRPVRIHTIHDTGNTTNRGVIQLDWREFWGGERRNYPPMDVWNRELVEGLAELKHWILDNRTTHRIQLTGSRRLSASLAFGSVFSAVSGFQVETWHSERWWKTDDHPSADTPNYGLDTGFSGDKTGSVVVSIGIIRDIRSEVEMSFEALGLTELPVLHIYGMQPVISAQHANRAVANIKQVIHDTVVAAAARQIHLFYAGPAHMALFLGHRLNAIAMQVQCYERTSVGVYVPTCTLFT